MTSQALTRAKHAICALFVLLGSVAHLAADEATLSNLPSGRTFHRAVLHQDKVILIGGFGESASEGNRRIDVFDLKTGEWTQRNFPFDRRGVILLPAVADGKLYVLDVDGPAFRRYDVSNDQWVELAAPSVPRPHSSMAAYNGKVIVVGGYTDKVTRENSVEIYDPEKNAWEIGPPLPDYRETNHFHLMAEMGEHLHVVGHYFGGKSHWIYDGKKWTRKSDVPMVDCGWKTAALEAVGGELILIQKIYQTVGDMKDAVFSYKPSEDRWEAAGPAPDEVPLMVFANVSYGGKVYLIGGDPAPSRVASYDVNTKTWQFSD
ncbi:MAG: kelch repeat-containing protein [Verrucomicrobiota bacterium]